MYQDTISKTYRVKVLTVKKIENFAKHKKITQSKAISDLVEMALRYNEEKQLDQELNDLSQDKKWLDKNNEWAKLNLN